MARRGVRTISSDIDLSSVLKVPDDLLKPLTVESIFGRLAPLELEIGSGKGMFINKAAKEQPGHCFLGVEIGKKYARYCAVKILRNELPNAVMVCGDAAELLRDWFLENSLAAVHVYFPDPWWKRAHKKRRILRTDVVKLIESRLQRGGLLHFWTDVEEYYCSALKLLANETSLQLLHENVDTAEDSPDFSTHFERRTLLHGENVFRSEFRKLEGP